MGQRIAVCATQVPFVEGGAEALAETLHQQLLARGFESALVTVPFAWTPRLRLLESALAWRLLTLGGPAGEPDLVIATRFPSYLIRHPNKVVWLVHQFRQVYDLLGTGWSDFGRSSRDRRIVELVRAMDARAFSEARALYAISSNVAERARRHNGVEPAVLYPPPRLAERLEQGTPGDYVLAVGRLDQLKRFDLLIESLRLVETPVRCRIAGTGPERARLEESIRRHRLESRVELLGRVGDDELVRLYRDCLAVFYAPYDEDFGFVTVEAFKAAKPILTAADSGAVLELVRHDENGRIHPPGDAAAIARSLDLLWRDRDRAAELGRRGRAAVESIGWDGVIAALTGREAVPAAGGAGDARA
ncbi:MAG TPA: glycosyltransferase family 4 protein [Thermoanaerobaculia bacterium]|nr:glycosyltransferase family 4 protein [Thermoanaerobaculia bacterium]